LFWQKNNQMKKIILLTSILFWLTTNAYATCYEICLGDGSLFLLITDDATGIPTGAAELQPSGCVDGPWVYQCPGLAGPADQEATDIMLHFDQSKVRPCTAEEKTKFAALLKGKVTIKYLDFKQLPQATIDFIKTH
jgi:hypothetical protein